MVSPGSHPIFCRPWRVLIGGLLFLLVGALLLGCQASPRAQGLIVFAIASAPSTFNPILATDASAERINSLLYAPLVELDQQGRATPGQIAWQQENANFYRLTLRPGLEPFHDGQAPRIQDVLATLKAARDRPNSPHSATLSHIASIELAADAASILVRLYRDDPRFAEKLHLGLIPADRDFESLALQPVGNGAFRLLARDAQNNPLLERLSDGQQIKFEVVPDPTVRALKLLRGEVNLLQNDLPYELYPRLVRDPNIRLKTRAGTTFSYLGFNLEDPVLSERRVRLAIAHALDRQAIVHALLNDFADPTESLLIDQHWAAPDGLQPYEYDPEQARALLAELGYGVDKPLRLSYKTSTDPFRLRVAAVIQAQLAEVGIDLRIQSYEWGTFFGDIKAGQFQLYSLSWVGIRSPDIFRYAFHSWSLPPAGANRGHYRNLEVDRMIEEAEQLPAADAKIMFGAAQRLIHHDLVYVPLWHERNLLLSREVTPVTPALNGDYRFLQQVRLLND